MKRKQRRKQGIKINEHIKSLQMTDFIYIENYTNRIMIYQIEYFDRSM